MTGYDFSILPQNHRLDAALVDAYRDLAPAPVNDSYGRRTVMDPAIKPIGQGMRLCGRAVTVDLPPDDNLMLHAALHQADPGDIIVARTRGDQYSGVWGELMTRAAMARGLGGLVLDGACRDSDWIRSVRWPVFCRTSCARGSRKNAPGHVNSPISCGGVVVEHGDLVLGDGDGVVVVSWRDAADLLPRCQAKVAHEAKRIAAIDAGTPKPAWLDPELERLGLLGS